MALEVLEEVRKKVLELVPPEAKVTKVLFEGPEISIYCKNPQVFLENENLVSKLASTLKKRINIRADSSILLPPEEAKKKIEAIVPEDAEIISIKFDPEFNSVIIEAKRPGKVIGKSGEVLKKIVKETGWYPKVLRAPTLPSEVLKGIRHLYLKHSKQYKKFLEKVAVRIYRKKKQTRMWAKIRALGGFHQVGRSCILLETSESKVLLDAGIDVAAEGQRSFPFIESLGFPINEIDAIVVSHAHLDHIGFIPMLYKLGYDGPIYCTPPTRDLMGLLLMDYVEVLIREDKEPPYTERDVKRAIQHCIVKNFGEVTDIAPDIRITLHNAGHILGSSTIHVHIGQGLHNLLYTGDLKFGFSRLLPPAVAEYPRVETLIIESTYGGKDDVHQPRKEAEAELRKIVEEARKNDGIVLIPTFAVGRGQEIMLTLEDLIAEEEGITVYIDGMVKEAAAIHTAYPEYLKKNVQRRILRDDSPFNSPIFEVVDSWKEREDVVRNRPAIIIAPSGALTGGPAVEYFKLIAEDPNAQIVLVGYQFEGSLGRKLQKGIREVPIRGPDGKTKALKIEAKVKTLTGFSGHSDRNGLMSFVSKLTPRPKRIIVNHGEPRKSKEFARDLRSKFKIETVVPRNLDSLALLVRE